MSQDPKLGTLGEDTQSLLVIAQCMREKQTRMPQMPHLGLWGMIYVPKWGSRPSREHENVASRGMLSHGGQNGQVLQAEDGVATGRTGIMTIKPLEWRCYKLAYAIRIFHPSAHSGADRNPHSADIESALRFSRRPVAH